MNRARETQVLKAYVRVSITYSHQEREVAQTMSSLPSGGGWDQGLLVEDVTRAGSPARLFSGFGGHD